MTGALIVGLTCTVLVAFGLLSARRFDEQVALLAVVARALKLEYVPDLRRVRGRVRTSPEGEGVQVRVSAIDSGSADGFLIECSLMPPLRMGLEIAPLNRPWRSWHWDPRFRDPDLREAFSVRALHEEQIEHLLSGWIVRELLRLQSSGQAPSLNDYSLKLTLYSRHDPQHLKHAIERAARLAEGIVLQRAKVPPSVLERDIERAFAPLAERLGGRFDRVHLALHVRDESGTLKAWVEHAGGSDWLTNFELCLERRLAPRLRVADARHASLWERWHELDVRTGDDRFDAAFVVCAERENALRTLTPQIRGALFELRERLEQVELEDGRISGRVQGVLTDSKALEAAALSLLSVGEAFEPKRSTRSAYR